MPIIQPTILDLMEYANDAAARAAYVGSDGGIDSYTKYLLHCDGITTAFVDSSGTAKAITANGNVTQTNAQFKFGTKSAYFDGASGYLETSPHADFSFDGAFTVDAWVRFASVAGSQQPLLATTGNDNWAGAIGAELVSGILKYYVGSTPTAVGSFAPAIDIWYHMALTRDASGDCRFFVAGVQNGATVRITENLTAGNAGGDFLVTIGDRKDGGGYWNFRPFNGWLDEFRVSKGIARWVADFTPPTRSYSVITSYSEAAIKQEGSYSLKGIAAITASLNKIMTRTVSPTINLTDKTIIKFDIRASRTGANIKIGIHDSGGTTTEITPTIAAVDTWQTVVWDISAVANANKDVIDSIIVTIVNADAANTFYIDNMFGDTINNYLIHRGRDRFRTAGYSLG